MEPTPQRLTMRALAAHAKVSQATVSRALKDDPRIREDVRARIKALAAELGYSPDPALAILSAYRNKIRKPSDRGKIAVWNFPRTLRKVAVTMERQYAGIENRARELGYSTELFSYSSSPEHQRELSRILFAQGVRGLLVGSLTAGVHALEDFNWEPFSSVSLSYSLQSPELHLVSNDHDQRCQLIYQKLRELGYRRIGYCSRVEVESNNRHLQVSSYLKSLFLDGISQSDLPPLLYKKYDDLDPIPWLKRHRFDAVIACLPDEFIKKLEGSRYKVPEMLGVAGLGLARHAESEKMLSGGLQHMEILGEVAVDLLHQLICHGDRGIPKRRQAILIEGSWQGSTTTRQREVKAYRA